MDLSYEAFKKGKLKVNKSKNDLSYSTFLANKEKQKQVDTEKQERVSQGLPVSVRDNRATPTIGGNIIRGAVKPFADVASNLLGGADLSNKYLGKVEGLGKIDITKSPLQKDNLKTIKKSAFTGLEIGSYASGGGAVIGAGKNAVKQTAKEFLKTGGKQLVKEGALTGGLGSVGYQGREGKINPLTVLRDTAIGGVAAPLLGAGFNKLLGKSAPKVASKVDDIEKSVVQVVDNKTGKLEYKTIPKGQLKQFDDLIDNTQSGIAGKEIDGKIYHLTAKTPKQMEERGFINSGVAKLDDIPKEQIPVKQVGSEIPTQQVAKQIEPEKITKDISSMADEIEGFDSGTFKQWSSDIRSLDMDEVTRVALGGKKTVENTIPANAYLSVAKNIANETGDLDLAQRLATSNVKSKTAQGLVASKLTTSDNIVDDLIEIKQARMKKSGISTERFEKESIELMNKLKSKIKEITDTMPTKEEFDNIINSLICK